MDSRAFALQTVPLVEAPDVATCADFTLEFILIGGEAGANCSTPHGFASPFSPLSPFRAFLPFYPHQFSIPLFTEMSAQDADI
jgi:hypothetical protein